MKLIFIAILFSIQASAVFSQNYVAGDTLNVVALNGINLRQSGNANGVKLGMLFNGEKVIILTNDIIINDSLDGFSGSWIRVASLTNKMQEGYVFDAYLSKYPVLNEFKCLNDFITEKYRWQDDEMKDYLPAMLEEYIKRVFRQTGSVTGHSNGFDGEGAHTFEITGLDRNARMIKHFPSEGHGIELELSNARISEVYYLIMNLIKFLPPEIGLVKEGLIKNPDYRSDCVGLDDYGCTVRVRRKADGKISIYFFNACC